MLQLRVGREDRVDTNYRGFSFINDPGGHCLLFFVLKHECGLNCVKTLPVLDHLLQNLHLVNLVPFLQFFFGLCAQGSQRWFFEALLLVFHNWRVEFQRDRLLSLRPNDGILNLLANDELLEIRLLLRPLLLRGLHRGIFEMGLKPLACMLSLRFVQLLDMNLTPAFFDRKAFAFFVKCVAHLILTSRVKGLLMSCRLVC